MSPPVRVAVAQINCTVGDFAGNRRRIVETAAGAVRAGADVLLTPELSLSGYPPEDLLLRGAFFQASDTALAALAEELAQFSDLRVIVGHPLAREGQRFNAASVLARGVVVGTYCKHDLPNYDVFDEQRYFRPDNRPFVFDVRGTRFGINICEDTWFSYAPQCAAAAGAQVLLIANGSPFHLGKRSQRLDVLRSNVCRHGLALVYANLVGGQDELVFDGGSFALDAQGRQVAMAPEFVERPGACDHDAIAIYGRDLANRCARHGAAAGRAVRRDSDNAGIRRLCCGPGAAVRGSAMGYHRGEHPGSGAWHLADGAIEQDRVDRVDHRQQERDGGRLLHALWRHGRRLCGHQGHHQDAGVSAGALPQRHRRRHSAAHSRACPERRAARQPDRSGLPASVRPARCGDRALHGAGCEPGANRGCRLPGARGAPDRTDDPVERIQAPAGAGWHSRHAPCFWTGLALPHYQSLPRR
ncbi:hypothetical protein SBBP2_130018 [Burkholderiales bacterium]|nr:hypothetical protein SBBP2_130018 [Burkholderiales bacterium]